MSKKVKKLLITISMIPTILLIHLTLDNVTNTDLCGYIARILTEAVVLLGVVVKAGIDGTKIIISKIKEKKQSKIQLEEVIDEASCSQADEKLKQELSNTSISNSKKSKLIRQIIDSKEKVQEK
ncbi:MAG: hypothetical protein PHC46_03550 [Clostridia bacterium]|nr:hypothetical protein [Clostridia bacterium]